MPTNDNIPDDDQPAYQPTREDLEDYEAALNLEAEQDCDCAVGDYYWDDQDWPPHRVHMAPPWSTDPDNTKNKHQ